MKIKNWDNNNKWNTAINSFDSYDYVLSNNLEANDSFSITFLL